jgi:hypothetical protein
MTVACTWHTIEGIYGHDVLHLSRSCRAVLDCSRIFIEASLPLCISDGVIETPGYAMSDFIR